MNVSSRKDMGKSLIPASKSPHEPALDEQRDSGNGFSWKTLAWIFFVALVIRLIVSSLLVARIAAGHATDPLYHWTFAYEAGRVARSLASGHGFSDPLKVPSGPTAWLAPVFPLILAGFFKVFGIYSTASALAIRDFNSVISALTCLPVFFLARKCFGRRIGIWSAGAWALFPHGIWAASAIVWDSSLSALIIACLVWFTLELQDAASLSAWAGYGALWGVSALTNPTSLAALPFFLAWLWFQQYSPGKRRILRASVTILICLTVMSPWLIRNYRVFHQPFLLKSNLWLEFVVGNSTHQTSFWSGDAHPDDSPAELREFVQRGEVTYMAEKKLQAIDFIRRHFSIYLSLCLRRFVYVWTGFWSFSPEYLASNADGGLRHIALISAYSFFTLLGLVRAIRLRRNISLPLVALLFSVPFVTYLTHPWPYYRFIIDPEIVVLASYGIVSPLSAFWGERRSPSHVQGSISTSPSPE